MVNPVEDKDSEKRARKLRAKGSSKKWLGDL